MTEMTLILLKRSLACASMMIVQACCAKNKCASSIELTVIDRDGAMMTQADGVTVDGSAAVFPCDEYASCSFRIGNAGDFTVSLEGYEPAALHVEIEKDDCDNALSQSIEVRMVSEGETAAPVVQRSVSDAC